MKKVLVVLTVIMTLSVAGVYAQSFSDQDVVKKEQKVTEKKKVSQSKKLVFSEICMNDLPTAVMNRLAQKGSIVKQVYMAYGMDGGRIYKICVLANDLHEEILLLGEDGKRLD